MTSLEKAGVFAIPTGEYFDRKDTDLYLLYSPLADCVTLALPEDIKVLNQELEFGNSGNQQAQQVLHSFLDYIPLKEREGKIVSPEEYSKLSVLVNYKCNFSCSYCYSAQGRSSEEMDPDLLKSILEFFIDSKRIRKRELTLFFSGGGEPLLSWPIVKFGLEYASFLAQEQGFEMNFILITNGSLLTDEIIDTLKKFQVNVCVSFEILEEVQNRQRCQFKKVSQNIKRMIERGLVPSISSTITKDSVGLLEPMVEEVVTTYPSIKNLNFDPAMDPFSFRTSSEMKDFYDAFIQHYFAAHRISRDHGCGLNCTMRSKFENVRERYCPGKLCLTPHGTISICHSVSSPLEPSYQKCIYGKVIQGAAPFFDRGKFAQLLGENLYSHAQCASCFAQFHCGGGCMMYRNHYSPQKFEMVCYYVRQFVKKMLLLRIDSEYREIYGNSFREVLLEQISGQ